MPLNEDDPPIKPKKKPARTAKPKTPKTPTALESLQAKFAQGDIKKLADAIGKKWGTGSVHLGDGLPDLHCVPTGMPSLDAILASKGPDRYGIPRGFYTEVSGEKASGKTILGTWILIQFQRHGLAPGMVNVESPSDLAHFAEMGLDLEHFLYVHAKYGERALTAFTLMAQRMDVALLDSWGALYSIKQIQAPKSINLNEDGPKASAAARSHLVNQTLINSIEPMEQRLFTFVGINQVRDKFGGFSFNPEKDTTGGNFLKHFQMLHLGCWQGKSIKRGDVRVGREIGVTIRKTKMGIDRLSARIPFFFHGGPSPEYDAVCFGEKNKLLRKIKGKGYVFDGTKMGASRFQAKEFLEEHPDVMSTLMRECRKVGVGEAPETVSDEDDNEFTDDDLDMLLPDDLIDEEDL